VAIDREFGRSEPESWEEAIAEFEKALLSQLYPRYPSTRKLATKLIPGL
jgi:transcriptional regulator of aroF, aroG, tyrA and aromatic amino acid transport